MFDLVMFDLDGTLVETAPEIADALNGLFAELRLPPIEVSDAEKWIGHGEKRTLELALASSAPGRERLAQGIDDELLQAFDAAYYAHCGRRSRVYPEVPRVLCALGASGVQRAVISNKEYRLAMKVLDAHGLSGDLELIVCGDSLPAKKPDPLPIRHCLDYFGMDPASALMVGDSETDIATAHAAGVQVWAVSYGYNGGQPVSAAKPDRLIENLGELLPAITRTRPLPAESLLIV